MHVLLLGATGNLGLRLIPALLAHNHTVVAFIRSETKLRSLITPRLAALITIHIGDALDTDSVKAALSQHGCDAIMNTAGNFAPPWKEQYLWKIAASVSSAAVRVGRERGKVLRAWFVGGLTSLVYPIPENTQGWKVEDYFPFFAAEHHRGTDRQLKKVRVEELEWSLLCVAWMWPESRVVDVSEGPRGHDFLVTVKVCPDWQGSWVGSLPLVGRSLDLFWSGNQYTTWLEDVADLVAEDLASGDKKYVGQFVGFKDRAKMKKST